MKRGLVKPTLFVFFLFPVLWGWAAETGLGPFPHGLLETAIRDDLALYRGDHSSGNSKERTNVVYYVAVGPDYVDPPSDVMAHLRGLTVRPYSAYSPRYSPSGMGICNRVVLHILGWEQGDPSSTTHCNDGSSYPSNLDFTVGFDYEITGMFDSKADVFENRTPYMPVSYRSSPIYHLRDGHWVFSEGFIFSLRVIT